LGGQMQGWAYRWSDTLHTLFLSESESESEQHLYYR
jgi:hypothetical protein